MGQTEDTYGFLLVPILLNKLPGEICRNLAHEHCLTNWQLNELRKAIFNELNIIDAGKL